MGGADWIWLAILLNLTVTTLPEVSRSYLQIGKDRYPFTV